MYEISDDMWMAAELGFEPAYEEVLRMAKEGYGVFESEENATEVINKYGSQ